MKTTTTTILSRMLRGYTEAMLWANTLDTECGHNVDAQERRPTRAALRQARRDVRAFLRHIETMDAGTSILGRGVWYSAATVREEWDAYVFAYDWGHAGHDFALSRNGHGAGFFGRETGERSGFPALQALARSYGEQAWRTTRAGTVAPF